MVNSIVFVMVAMAIAAPVSQLFAQPAEAGKTQSISQFGITWRFAEPVVFGQFVNGDYWVVGPVRITEIEPRSAEVDGRTTHGSMINPKRGMTQGYDSAMFGAYGPAYSADLNVALKIAPGQPLVVGPESSLISSISIEKAGNRPQLEAAAVLTVLTKPAPADSFRPPYFGNDKSIRFNLSQLDLRKLPSLKPVEKIPDPTKVAKRFERPWFDHILSWTGRYAHPRGNMPDYGRDIALAVGDAALLLTLDIPEAEKRLLATRIAQFGIDLYAIAAGGGTWQDLGGHMHGRKLPILIAGLVLDDKDMLAIGKSHANAFQEDRQTWYVTAEDVGRKLHTADKRPRVPYIAEDVGIAEWGEQHTRSPDRDGRNWDAYYRTIVGYSIISHVLAARLMGLEQAWNWPPLFDYAARYWSIEKDRKEGAAVISPFHHAMWTTYRKADAKPAPALESQPK